MQTDFPRDFAPGGHGCRPCAARRHSLRRWRWGRSASLRACASQQLRAWRRRATPFTWLPPLCDPTSARLCNAVRFSRSSLSHNHQWTLIISSPKRACRCCFLAEHRRSGMVRDGRNSTSQGTSHNDMLHFTQRSSGAVMARYVAHPWGTNCRSLLSRRLQKKCAINSYSLR